MADFAAGSVPAYVVDVRSCRDCAVGLFVDPAVWPYYSLAVPHGAVAGVFHCAGPDQAFALADGAGVERFRGCFVCDTLVHVGLLLIARTKEPRAIALASGFIFCGVVDGGWPTRIIVWLGVAPSSLGGAGWPWAVED